MKYCETIKPGFYFAKSKESALYLTGTTKGNKWIQLGTLDEPRWVNLLWNCIKENEIENYFVYSETNPTQYNIL